MIYENNKMGWNLLIYYIPYILIAYGAEFNIWYPWWAFEKGGDGHSESKECFDLSGNVSSPSPSPCNHG